MAMQPILQMYVHFVPSVLSERLLFSRLPIVYVCVDRMAGKVGP